MTPAPRAPVLGIEIGGTKLQLGVGAGDGSDLVTLERRRVDPLAGARGILEQVEESAAALLARHPLAAIGVGFGGPIDRFRGRVVRSHQIEGWEEYPLVEWLHARSGVPVVLANDCDAAALAEARFGAGRGRRSVFFTTVGSGVGGGFVLDGRIFGSDRPAVAEIGHLRPGPGARAPGNTVESLASGRGIEDAVRRALEEVGAAEPAGDGKPADALLARCAGEPARITAEVVAEAAANGHPVAVAALQGAVEALGWALGQVVTLLAPEVLVVGGGVSLIGRERFLEPLERAVAQYVFPPLAGSYVLEPATLGETVVVHGALALARDALGP